MDLRGLNQVLIVESWPIPTFQDIIESFGDPPPAWFSLMDAFHGFLQLSVTEDSSKLLGLQSDMKTYVFRRVPFGMLTSGFIYQKLMNRILTGYQYLFACAYVDDLICYSSDFTTHLKHLRLILERILHSGLRLCAEKCLFAQNQLRYLGMIISHDSIKPDPDKLEVIKNAKAPTNAKLLKSFLGLCAFFRRFIRGFSQICQPFRDLLKKNAPFVWKIEHQNAFDTLKKAMTSAPICLGMPRWKDTFIITSDSSRPPIHRAVGVGLLSPIAMKKE